MYISKIIIYYVTIGYILISRFIVYIFVCLIFFLCCRQRVWFNTGYNSCGTCVALFLVSAFQSYHLRILYFWFFLFFSIISEFLLFFLFVVCFSGRIFIVVYFYLGYSVCCSLFVLMGGASHLAGTGLGLPTFLFLYCI